MIQPAKSPESILQRLDWTVIRRLDGILQGDYRTLFRGFGLDLADLREYQFSDDVRYVDWNVTARMNTPYIRQHMEDRDATAWFLLDVSPSVDFGTTKTLKRNMLIDFVTVLARMLTRHTSRVGAVFYNGDVQKVVPAAGGKIQVLRLIKDLLDQPHLKQAPPTNLASLFETGIRVIKRRSLVFIVSDFISTPGWDRTLNLLTRRNEVIIIRLSDPRESELPDMGPVVFEDAETGEQLYLETNNKQFRKRFLAATRKRELELNDLFVRSGVHVLPLSTEDDLVTEILRFAMARRQNKSNLVRSPSRVFAS